ncbi:MAG: phospholipase D-like domain-containing protein [Myxococcales bacterium]
MRTLRRPACLALLLLSACTFPNHRHDLRVWEELRDGDDLSLALHQSVGLELKDGNQADLIMNGAIFDEMVKEIEAAQSSIHIVTFIWRPSRPSDQLIEALAKRRENVDCRIIVDPVGSIDFADQVRMRLVGIGCDVRYFRPLGPGSRTKIRARNHRKMLIVDGYRGITGGFGIWKSWEGEGLTPDEWRETNVRVVGPAVRDMQLAFAENWQEVGGPLLPADAFPDIPCMGPARAAFVGSSQSATISAAERMTALVIAAAKYRLWIENAYFIPSTAISDMLVVKSKHGVDVRVVAPGPIHDWPPVRAAQRTTYDRLLEVGVRIWEYQPSMMHAKTMLVDDRFVVVGSTNFDPLSLKLMEEGSLIVEDPALAAGLDQAFRGDVGHSKEITRASWERRNLVERMARQLTGLIGGFL